MSFVSTLIIGAFGGAAGNSAIRLWQYQRDHWLKRIDWFCSNAERISDLGTEYWCEVGNEEKKNTDAIREIQIIGLQMQLDGMLVSLTSSFDELGERAVKDKLASLSDVLTGGDFQSKRAKADFERARTVQMCCAELMIEVRKSSDRANAPVATLRRGSSRLRVMFWTLIDGVKALRSSKLLTTCVSNYKSATVITQAKLAKCRK